MLKIWGRKTSSNVQKAMWLIGELGLPYERVDVGGRYGGLETPEFRRLNPNSRIPVLEDDSHIMWESHTIVRYIAARYGKEKFWPDDPAERTIAERWMDWTLVQYQPAVLGVFSAYFRTTEDKRDWSKINATIAGAAMQMKILDDHLADKTYVAGDKLSVGDFAVASMLFRYFTLDVMRPSLPHAEAYYTKLTERPAYREHVMVSYEELRGDGR